MNIENRRIILTGAASGIGRALLHQLAARFAHIIAVDVHATALNEAIASVPTPQARIYPLVTDIAERESVDTVFTYAQSTLGGIDIFIANAGIAYYEKIPAADWSHIDDLFRLNVYSPIYSALKMRDLHPAQPYLVVMTASAMAFCGLPGYSLYSATKAALDRFADAYRFELPANGRLMLAYPIATRTKFFETGGSHAGRIAPTPVPSQTPDFVARRIIHGIERGASSVNPSVLFNVGRVLWGWLPFMRRVTQQNEMRVFERWLHGA